MWGLLAGCTARKRWIDLTASVNIPRRIATELTNVLAHPEQSCRDVLPARGPLVFGRKAVVHRHGDHPVACEEHADIPIERHAWSAFRAAAVGAAGTLEM